MCCLAAKCSYLHSATGWWTDVTPTALSCHMLQQGSGFWRCNDEIATLVGISAQTNCVNLAPLHEKWVARTLRSPAAGMWGVQPAT